MIKIFKSHKFQIISFILLIFLISSLTFWRAFKFDFWGEDWEQLWFAKYQPAMINNPQEMQHPFVIYEELLLVNFFGFNTVYWQSEGLLLKILSTFAVSLMVFGLTKSKKAAVFSGLIYASSVGGLASFTWVAAHASALEIPVMCMGIYFWVTSRNDAGFRLVKKRFVLAIALLIFSVWADPSRGIFGSFLVIFWEILSFIQHPKRLKESMIIIFILLFFLLFNFFIFQYILHYANNTDVAYNLSLVIANPVSSLTNFLTNIGNLLVGWAILIPQNAFAVSTKNIYGTAAGYLFLFQTIFILILFFRKRSESLKILLFFSVWIPIFFLPNWLLPNQEMIFGKVIGMTHRYLTLSAVGLVCYLGYILSKIKENLLTGFLLLFVVMSNIFVSNKILKQESYYLSIGVTKPIWDRIEKDIPAGEENSLFFFQGEDEIRVNVVSQAKIPFAIRRGITSRDKWPISTSDPGMVKGYLCGIFVNERKVPLSHLHGWYIKGNTAEDISTEIREEFSKIDCSSI